MQIYCVLYSSFFYAITVSCKYIDPNLVVFMQLYFHANKYIVSNIAVFVQLHFHSAVLFLI